MVWGEFLSLKQIINRQMFWSELLLLKHRSGIELIFNKNNDKVEAIWAQNAGC